MSASQPCADTRAAGQLTGKTWMSAGKTVDKTWCFDQSRIFAWTGEYLPVFQ
jgi:hypothetical protein